MTVQVDPEGTESKYLHRYSDFGSGNLRVLEVGCGDGRLTWRYADFAARVTAIDLDPDDLRVAMIERPAYVASKVSLARADAIYLPFGSRTFDLALFAWSF